MNKPIKCTGIITNKDDGRYNNICHRTLAIFVDQDTIELKCPICKTKKRIKIPTKE